MTSTAAVDALWTSTEHPVQLSPRERQVLSELARGNTTEGVAASIYLSPHTVRCYVKSAMRKLGAHTRSHAVAIALAEGAITLDVDIPGRG